MKKSTILVCVGAAALLSFSPAFAGPTASAHIDTSGVNMQPAYPASAVPYNEKGAVILGVSVNDDGKIKHIVVLQSSGYDDLDDAAANAVNNWKFVPAMENGSSQDGVAAVQIVFNPPSP